MSPAKWISSVPQGLYAASLLCVSRTGCREAGWLVWPAYAACAPVIQKSSICKRTGHGLAQVPIPKWLAAVDSSRAIAMKGRICKGLKCFPGLMTPFTECGIWRGNLVPNQTLKCANIPGNQRDRNSCWYTKEISNKCSLRANKHYHINLLLPGPNRTKSTNVINLSQIY